MEQNTVNFKLNGVKINGFGPLPFIAQMTGVSMPWMMSASKSTEFSPKLTKDDGFHTENDGFHANQVCRRGGSTRRTWIHKAFCQICFLGTDCGGRCVRCYMRRFGGGWPGLGLPIWPGGAVTSTVQTTNLLSDGRLAGLKRNVVTQLFQVFLRG